MKFQDSKAAKRYYEFGVFRLDLEERLLSSHDGETIPLAPKIFETLVFLIENKGRIVEKEELMKRLWPDRYVEVSSLPQNIFMLRKILGESSGNAKYIENIPRRGYRFIGLVNEVQEVIEETEEKALASGEEPAPKVNQAKPARPDEAKITIAVLPMVNETGDPAWEYLADGVTDSLIKRLSHLPQVHVIARSLVYRYKGKEVDALKIGRELTSDKVLVTRVVAREGKLIIRAELVEVSTGWRAWGEEYQPQLSDIRKLEAEISTHISATLHLKLTEEEKKRLGKHETRSVEAYQAFLMGRYCRSKRTDEGYRKAIEYFEEATKLDPGYALAYSALANSYIAYDFHGILPPWETSTKAKAAAIEALVIDDTLAEAHTALACVKMMYERDWSNAEREFKRAIELDPEFAHAHNWYSYFLMAMGRIDESLAENQIGLRLDPLDESVNQYLGWHHIHSRQFYRAIVQLEKTLADNTDFFLARVTLGMAYEQKGEVAKGIEEFKKAYKLEKNAIVLGLLGHAYAHAGNIGAAQRILEELEELSKRIYVPSFSTGLICTSLGQNTQAFEWFGRHMRLKTSG
ncbi:MAG TPA: winged helix-turn-helix domain-containing protein [Pyrinomonadaceae bacterium]|nr:winged helix-turn-helix domain-containing protein [Pyrinomonadaceae bacterium]